MTAVEEEPRRLALRCGQPHPLDDGVLCRRLSGHGGVHGSDDGTDWADGWGSE